MTIAPHIVQSWRDAARRPEIRERLEAMYRECDEAVRKRAPVCRNSGRCCNFKDAGHLLYVTGLEAAYVLDRLKGTEWAHSEAETSGVEIRVNGAIAAARIRDRALTAAEVDAARERGDCPFLGVGRCMVHIVRPMGCRVYFCDPTAQAWQNDLAECMQTLLRIIHADLDVEYRYAEWRQLLGVFVASD